MKRVFPSMVRENKQVKIGQVWRGPSNTLYRIVALEPYTVGQRLEGIEAGVEQTIGVCGGSNKQWKFISET